MSCFAFDIPDNMYKAFKKAYEFPRKKRVLFIYTGRVPAKRVYKMDGMLWTYFD